MYKEYYVVRFLNNIDDLFSIYAGSTFVAKANNGLSVYNFESVVFGRHAYIILCTLFTLIP